MTKPKTSSSSSAKDVFSYLLMIAMFYVGVISFITLLFQYINIQLPDVLDYSFTSSSDLVRGAISALVVAWPVFIGMNWLISKDLKLQKEKSNIWIRKWMLNLTVFIAAITIIVDLITLINSFLEGELTLRFGLKVLSILTVAVLVFGYELWELKRDVSINTRIPVIAAIASSAFIVGWVIAGFFLIGSPATQREVRFDEVRIQDLEEIQYQLLDQWIMRAELPESLDSLEDQLTGYTEPVDPETGLSYIYTKTSDLSFELCTTFSHASDSQVQEYSYRPVIMYYEDYKMQNWEHEAGYTCFDRTIDPELYPTEKE